MPLQIEGKGNRKRIALRGNRTRWGTYVHAIRRLVEIALYGTGDQRRFVQDGPVFQEVWISLVEAAGGKIPVLIQPYKDLPPAQLAQILLTFEVGPASNSVIYNNTLVSLKTDLATLVFKLVPLSHWATHTLGTQKNEHPTRSLDGWVAEALAPRKLWLDLPLPDAPEPDRAAPVLRDLLAFFRVVGAVSWLIGSAKELSAIVDVAACKVRELTQMSPTEAREAVSALVTEGWGTLLGPEHQPRGLSPCDGKGVIYSITNDRPVHLAISESHKTVKSDAARRLFDISCRHITWAVIDSGIDATHPAFSRDPSAAASGDIGKTLDNSRVERTFDFSHLRELLLGDVGQLPERFAKEEPQALIETIRARSAQFQPIDWGLLSQLLELDPESYSIPKNRHGTHVAGIIGANWKKKDSLTNDDLIGVCPDIRLIDIRVCKADGSSDEFVLIAALQFLRYLNAHADMMAVHGINMSLSLEHDVANFACGRTPVCIEAERAVQSGIVVVAAAGNRGYRHIKAADETSFYQFCAVSITDPGNAEAVITVGSTHRREPHNFGVSYFSSRGPTGDGRSKPDLVAPGEKILSAVPQAESARLDGTSMAAPHVSGAAALLMARNAELMGRPVRIKEILCDTATDLGRERYFQGNGLVDVLRALQSV